MLDDAMSLVFAYCKVTRGLNLMVEASTRWYRAMGFRSRVRVEPLQNDTSRLFWDKLKCFDIKNSRAKTNIRDGYVRGIPKISSKTKSGWRLWGEYIFRETMLITFLSNKLTLYPKYIESHYIIAIQVKKMWNAITRLTSYLMISFATVPIVLYD